MSNQANLNDLKTKLLTITNEDTTKDLIDYCNKTIENYGLDETKVERELIRIINKTPSIGAPRAFVEKIVWSMANSEYNKYKKDYKVLNATALFNAFKELGIVGESWEKNLIVMIEDHCYTNFPVSIERIIETNKALLKYCENKGIKTCDEYIKLLLKSRMASNCNIPLQMLTKRAKDLEESWDRMIEELEETTPFTENVIS